MKAYTRALMATHHVEPTCWIHGQRVAGSCRPFPLSSGKQKQGLPQKQRRVLAMACRQTQATQHPSSHGDFNMSLFKVVPELRSRGVPVQLAAWYPWRVEGEDEPTADSCGIFMCAPCAVAPTLGMNIFHEAWWTLDEHERNGGPGQALSTYLPNADDVRTTSQFLWNPQLRRPRRRARTREMARARANLIKEWACPSEKKIGRIYTAAPRTTT